MYEQRPIAVTDPTHVGTARRTATEIAARLDFDERTAGRLGIVVTELASNIAKHAGEGEIVFTVSHRHGAKMIDVLALDRGRGMEDVERCLRDGYSSSGTQGTGLGAVVRQSVDFDIHSVAGGGTAIYAAVGAPVRRASGTTFDIGAVSTPKAGELVCGDAWCFREQDGVGCFLVVDGLGHGQYAFEAATAGVAAFENWNGETAREILTTIHGELRSTRGAAAAVARIDPRCGLATFSGVGNVMATILSASGRRQMVSHGGIVGHKAPRIAEFSYPWPDDGVLVLASDGLQTHWDLDRYRGLVTRTPGLIAGVLYRDWVRGRDDTTVVVARARKAMP
jgi:anti-sigma regulatory factor (Ser/Thr protein kinase)